MIAPCCQAQARVEPVDSFDFAKSPYLNQLRDCFDQGEKPKECDSCWNTEKHGHKSRRQSAIEFFQDAEPDRTIQLQSIDHSATWACNLACIMCGPHSSSLWASELDLDRNELQQMGKLFQKKNNFLKNLDLTHIKKIHFNGGEPMLNNDQTQLLVKLEQENVLKDVFLSYNSNGTIMPSKEVVGLWGKTRLVKIFFSIDAIGSAFEYIRWPATWEQTTKNILDMKKNLPGNVMFGFNVTVASYNLLELTDLCEWFDQNIARNREGDASDFCWQFANNFDPKNLPPKVKQVVINQIKNNDRLQGIVNYLESTLNYNENLRWLQQLDKLDAKRGTSWKNSLQLSKYI